MQSTAKELWFCTVLCRLRRSRSPEKKTVAEIRDYVQHSRRRRPIGEETRLSVWVCVCIRLIGDGEEGRSSSPEVQIRASIPVGHLFWR
ncbi:hypothetical protein AAC387_Pa01g1924 [Persea americana]